MSKTLLEVLQASSLFFQKNGVESARLNAEHLLAHQLACKRLDLYMQFDRPLDEKELEPLREQVKKRAQGVPLQHLLGTAEFFGRSFLCDARALIPRPETEQLVELVIADCGLRIADRKKMAADAASDFSIAENARIEAGAAAPPLSAIRNPQSAILDVGTGSGVIALTLAAELPEATVHAIDISPDALALARENAGRLGLDGRVDFQQGDLFEKIDSPYDLIVANLPYIARDEIPRLAREVQHDPRCALDGGPVGDEILLRLIASATTHFCPAGRIALEIGHDQPARLSDALARNGYHDIECKADHQGVVRFLFAKYG